MAQQQTPEGKRVAALVPGEQVRLIRELDHDIRSEHELIVTRVQPSIVTDGHTIFGYTRLVDTDDPDVLNVDLHHDTGESAGGFWRLAESAAEKALAEAGRRPFVLTAAQARQYNATPASAIEAGQLHEERIVAELDRADPHGHFACLGSVNGNGKLNAVEEARFRERETLLNADPQTLGTAAFLRRLAVVYDNMPEYELARLEEIARSIDSLTTSTIFPRTV